MDRGDMRTLRTLIFVCPALIALVFAAAVSAADTRPPQTRVTSGPFESSYDRTAIFTFESDEGGATFQCSLDKGGISPCSSPTRFSNLALGSHTFYVRSTDSSGNVGKPAQVTWAVLTRPAS